MSASSKLRRFRLICFERPPTIAAENVHKKACGCSNQWLVKASLTVLGFQKQACTSEYFFCYTKIEIKLIQIILYQFIFKYLLNLLEKRPFDILNETMNVKNVKEGSPFKCPFCVMSPSLKSNNEKRGLSFPAIWLSI